MRSILALTLPALFLGAVSAQAASASSAADIAQVRKAADDLTAAWRAKNVERVVGQFADDATVMAPGAPAMTGKKPIRDYVSYAVRDPGFSLDMTVDQVAASGQLAYSRGKFVLTMTNPETRASQRTSGSFVSVFARQTDGSWKVVEDISAPN